MANDILYDLTPWQDAPSTLTPINAENLNERDSLLKKVVDKTNQLQEQKLDKTGITLATHTDGLIYLFVDGKPVGIGLDLSGGGTVNPDNPEKITLSDGVVLTTLMFNDDFEGDTLGSTWKPTYGHDNGDLNNWWTAKEKNLGVADSCLRLTMLRDNPTSNFEISASKVETMQHGTADNYGFDTGYCEVRFKLDKVGEGIWPAIWCVGQTQTDEYTNITDTSVTRKLHGRTWPWAGEIDHFDAIGSAFSSGLIWQTDPYKNSIIDACGSKTINLEADTWHTIGLYKSKNEIIVYYDRTLIDTFDISGNNCFSSMGEKLIINLSTGKALGGALPEDVNEVNMYVDYVRVYSLGESYTTLKEQKTASLLPDYLNGYAVVPNRSWLLYPQFAENTQNTALYWESSDTSVAKVENGYITSVANGNCNIVATDSDGNKVIDFTLTVKADAGVMAEDIVITSSVTNVEASGSTNITANIYPTHCDVLTPVLSIVSGSEYCEIDGTTVRNINTSGQTQSVVVRVGTNNPNVYEDVEISMMTGVSYEVSVTNGLSQNYQPKAEYFGKSVSGAELTWTDSLSDKVLYYINQNCSFDGTKIVSTSTIDEYVVSNRKRILTNVSEGTIFGVLSNISANSGWGYITTPDDYANNTKLGHYTGIYFNSVNNARIREMPEDGQYSAIWTKNIPITEGELIVAVIKFANNTVEYSLYNENGLIDTTESKDLSNITDENGNVGEVVVGYSSRGNGIKGNTHQYLVYDRALTTDEITTVASELVTLHVGNV